MVRAAAGGRVDFSKAELLNPLWHRRLSLLLGELAEEEVRELSRLNLLKSLAYVILPGLRSEPGQAWETYHRESSRILDDYVSGMLDLKSPTEKDRQVSFGKSMENAWSREFGDINDQATKDKIDRTAAALKAQRNLPSKDAK